jgi:hypothetical protein
MSKILERRKLRVFFFELLVAPQKTGCAFAN